MLVMLRSDWGGPFRRSETDEKNKPIAGGRRLEFQPGVPLDVADEDLPLIADCLGKNVHAVELDGKGRPRIADPSAPKPKRKPAAEPAPAPAAATDAAPNGAAPANPATEKKRPRTSTRKPTRKPKADAAVPAKPAGKAAKPPARGGQSPKRRKK